MKIVVSADSLPRESDSDVCNLAVVHDELNYDDVSSSCIVPNAFDDLSSTEERSSEGIISSGRVSWNDSSDGVNNCLSLAA